MSTFTPTTGLGSALGEFNKDVRGLELKERIENEGATLDGTDCGAGRLFGDDPDAFVKIATDIGDLSRNAQGIEAEITTKSTFDASATGKESKTSVVHDPASLIGHVNTVTTVSAGGGLETKGKTDITYKPNYEGPAWTTGFAKPS